jgi:ribonuclease VapC
VIIDSSALIAILHQEPDGAEFARILEDHEHPKISAVTLFETAMVAGDTRSQDLDELIHRAGARVVPFDADQAGQARRAFAAFGRGSGSRAELNFGDCMAYALAKVTGEPLLFKGEDLTHTDVTPAG